MYLEEKLKLVKTTIRPKLPLMKNIKMAKWYKKLGWMLIIWLASVCSLALVASLFKLLMYSAGMRTH